MSDLTRLSIKDPADVLPADERIRIWATEQYRSEIRRQLDSGGDETKGRKGYWREKLMIPAIIGVLTLVISEFAIPRASALMDRERRRADTAAALMREVGENVAAMRAAGNAWQSAIDEYWVRSAAINAMVGDFSVKRDLKQMSDKEFERQDSLIENDRRRVHDRRDRASDAYGLETRQFSTWLAGVRLRINTLYEPGPERDSAEQALADLAASLEALDRALTERDGQYDRNEYENITGVTNARALYRRNKLTADAYRQQVAPFLERLRTTEPMPPQQLTIPDDKVATVFQFIQSGRQIR